MSIRSIDTQQLMVMIDDKSGKYRENVPRSPAEFGILNEQFNRATIYSPHEDNRLVICYKFLYGDGGDTKLDLGEMKKLANSSGSDAVKVMFAARLYTTMYAYGGTLNQDNSMELVRSMLEKDDEILKQTGNELNAVDLSKKYWYGHGALGSELAITIGAVQSLGLMRNKGLFGLDERLLSDGGKFDAGAKRQTWDKDGLEEYVDMMAGATKLPT
jgi:hypothetical protein